MGGFVTGPEDSKEHGLGVHGERLHDWLSPGVARARAAAGGRRLFDESWQLIGWPWRSIP